jgi:F0F1-type ATP synthase membrane subunit a
MMLPLPLAADPMEHVLPHELFHVGPLVVNNQMFMAVVAAVLMLLIFPTLFRRARADAPHGGRNFFEAILEFLRVEVFRPALKEHTDRFVPFLWTLFFFILFCNVLGQLPIGEIITLITHRESHWGGTATGALTTTGALAVCAFLFIHINGIAQVAKALRDGTYGHHGHHEEHSSDGTRGHEAAQDLEHVRGEALPADVPADFKAFGDPTKHYGDDQFVRHHHGKPDDGHLHNGGAAAAVDETDPVTAFLLAVPYYLWNFAPHPFKPGPGESPIKWAPDILMWGMLLVLEMIGAVIKPFALMVRLFANMIAGHIVLAALILLIPVTKGLAAQLGVGVPVTVLSLMIWMLEIFVAFLQAYIFTFLVTLFIASAVAPEH